MVLVVRILPWAIFLQCLFDLCSAQLDWQRSNEIKHDIHPR